MCLQLYEQYDDSEIGALDHEDIDGCVQQGSHMLDTILEDFESKQGNLRYVGNSEDIDGCVQQGSHMLDTILEDFEKKQGNLRYVGNS